MASEAIQALPKAELVSKYDRLRNTMVKYKEDAKKVGRVGARYLAGGGGAVLSGVSQHYYPEIWEGSGMPTDAAGSLVLAIASFFQTDRSIEDMLVDGAIGMGAPAVSRLTKQVLDERASSGG